MIRFIYSTMSHPPPPLPRLRRNISRSLENISEVVDNYNRRPPTLPPRPFLPARRLQPTPKQPDPEYDVVGIARKHEDDNVSFSSTSFEFQSYNLENFCAEVKLPKAVEVTDGFCGATEDIPVGYQLMMYFQKTTRVMQAKDVLDTVYNIPLNSSLKFAPIDDLQLKPKTGDYSGFYYDSIEEMLQERPTLPKIICAKGSYTKGKHSINPKDILFPKKIDKTAALRGGKVIGLQCVKLSGEEIKLPLECACGFSTATQDNQLYLPEYIEYVNQFPVKVFVFGIDSSMQFGIPTTLFLQGEHLLKTLVARSLHSEEEIMTEISMDLPIRIRCLSLDNEASEQERVKKVYETFNASKVSAIYSLTKTSAQHKAQQQLYAEVRQEYDSIYYEIIAPDNINKTDTVQSKPSNDTLNDASHSSPKPSRHRIFKTNLLKHRSQSVGDDDGVENGDAASPVRKLKLRNLLPGKHRSQSVRDADGNDEEDHDVLCQTDVDQKQEFAAMAESLKAEIKAEIKQELESSLREEIRKLRINNAHCLQQLSRINETIEKLQKQNEGTSPPKTKQPIPKPRNEPSSSQSSSSDTLEEIYKLTPKDNIKFLQSLDHVRVLQLLDGMKLEKYKSEFKSSFVDGQLLATLSQTELVELKVNSLLHQRKLLNIIEGHESAQKYLLFAQEDPYT